ncbi:hypothetical protein T4D_4901 [Trichinella pseudospiralis]|uniref:Uncharacterized protein n=1 Tax=Trichinella pseudospiralis TaxID=6337 RepID=A0A0V1FQU4_TRIPS|nr:hypothetical protein T4D_4901 [Trichinella pseudospiralis]
MHKEVFNAMNAAHEKIGPGGEKTFQKNKKRRINGQTSHRKRAICFSRFVKNAIRRERESFQKA